MCNKVFCFTIRKLVELNESFKWGAEIQLRSADMRTIFLHLALSMTFLYRFMWMVPNINPNSALFYIVSMYW